MEQPKVDKRTFRYSIFPLCGLGKGRPNAATYAEPPRSGTLEQITEATYRTAWSGSTFKNLKRDKASFEAADIIGLDFDNIQGSVQDIVNKLNELGISYALNYSTSHMLAKDKSPALPRFRVIIPLHETITKISVFEATWLKLQALFPDIDAQCKDPSRLYFSSNPNFKAESVIKDIGIYLIPETKIPIKAKPNKPKSNGDYMLGIGVTRFMEEAHTGIPGGWNTALMAAFKDLGKSGMPYEEAIDMLQKYAPEPFDGKDLKTASKAHYQGSLKPYRERSDAEGGSKKGIPLGEKLDFIEESYGGKYAVLQSLEGKRISLLKKNDDGSCTKIDRDIIVSDIGRDLRNHYGMAFSGKECESLTDTWFSQTDNIAQDPPFTRFLSQPGLCYRKLDFDPTPGPAPIWEEMMGRTSNAPALQAFIWSLFVPDCTRQQYVWIYGDGGNGKSTISDFEAKLLGAAFLTTSAGSSFNNKHFTSTFEGKRLINFTDTNSPTFVQSEAIKMYTGDDMLLIEPKFMNAYNIKNHVKLQFQSNFMPEISDKKADMRRLILCKMEPLPEGIKPNHRVLDLLWSERAQILYQCKQYYDTLSTADGVIDCEQEDSQIIATGSNVEFESLFEEFFVLDPEGKLTNVQAYDAYSSGLYKRKIKKNQFIHWMKNQGIEHKKMRFDGRVQLGFKGIKLR